MIGAVLRMTGDVWFSILFVAVLLLLTAAALLALLVLPVFGVFLVLGRLLYWLVSRVPMWADPNSVGRLHSWPVWVNAAVSLGIFGALALVARPLFLPLARGYVGFVAGKLAAVAGWAVDGGGDAAATGIADLVTHPAWFGYGVMVVMGLAILYMFLGIVGEATRLRMIE